MSDPQKSDPELYDFLPYRDRPPIIWPEGKTCAVWIAPNLEYYELDPPLNPNRKAWSKPHPDIVGYSHRDHANRIGHWRMAEAMSRHGFPGSVSLSVALCDHIPEVVADGVARLTLNRPDKLNSFTAAMHLEVRDALQSITANDSVRVLVLTGAGRGFCAGQDLADVGSASLGDIVKQFYTPLVETLRALPIPVIAAVNGVAAGAGFGHRHGLQPPFTAGNARQIGLFLFV